MPETNEGTMRQKEAETETNHWKFSSFLSPWMCEVMILRRRNVGHNVVALCRESDSISSDTCLLILRGKC